MLGTLGGCVGKVAYSLAHHFSRIYALHFYVYAYYFLLKKYSLISLARQCAQLWLKTRESLGYPLGVVSETVNLVCPEELVDAAVKKVSFCKAIKAHPVFSFTCFYKNTYMGLSGNAHTHVYVFNSVYVCTCANHVHINREE